MFIKTRRHLLKKGPNFMIALLGLITLGAFAIDPMIQQILDTPQREIALNNVTASMMSNRGYTSLAVDDRNTFDDENNARANGTRLLALETSFLNQLTSTTYLPRFDCTFPRTHCEFNDITMLGLCSNFSDVTDITTHECEQHASGVRDPAHFLTCNFTVQGVITYRNLTLNFGAGDLGTDVGYVYDNFRSILENLELLDDPPVVHQPVNVARLFTIKVVGTVNGNDFLDDTSLGIPETRVTMTNWYWCQQNYSKVVFDGRSGSISEASGFKTAPLLFAPRSGILPNEYIFASNEELASFYDGSSLQEVQGSYSTNFFRVNMHSLFGLLDTKWPQYLDPSIRATLHPQVSVGSNYVNNGDYVLDAIGMASFMVNADISQLVQNIATAVTNQVQLSAYNSNNNTTQGTVYAIVPYYHVRWGWRVLPLLEAVAAAVLLCVTIWLNRLPLLKSSNVGLLAHGPEDAVSYRVAGLETANKWVTFGDQTTVMLLEDEKGWTRLTPS
ncbi:hypothetical protein LTR84_009301 [Exophiala bonariae]|uniref:Uncharacterized protein n=1 Tax=Exophiala bonariae TaxID=1690606 RepID=A0AAV9MV08_9EURO|nr:hypothetical protein LTR84_009301 [Exophiala bonariae]